MWIGLNILAVLIFIELVIASLVYLLCHVYTKCKRKCNRTKVQVCTSYMHSNASLTYIVFTAESNSKPHGQWQLAPDFWCHTKAFLLDWMVTTCDKKPLATAKLMIFLDAFSHLFKRVCPSVGRSVRRSVLHTRVEFFRNPIFRPKWNKIALRTWYYATWRTFRLKLNKRASIISNYSIWGTI